MTHNVLLVDDRRVFRPGKPGDITTIRRIEPALEAIAAMIGSGQRLAELWLDHDLGQPDGPDGPTQTTMPLVELICGEAFAGRYLDVQTVYIHTSNSYARQDIARQLTSPRWNGRFDVRLVDALDHLVDDPTLPAHDDL